MRLRWGCLGLLLVAAASQALEFEVSGVSGDALRNVTLFLQSRIRQLPDDEELAAERIADTAGEALRAVGFYQPQITATRRQDDHWRVAIKAGQPVRISELVVKVTGEGENDPIFRRYLRNLPLHQDDLLHHGDYETMKQHLQELASQRGFVEGKFSERLMEVDVANHSARIHLVYDSGPRYRFGAIHVTGSHIDDDQVQRLIRLNEGDPYDIDALSNASQRLSRSQWFETVRVLPRRDLETDQAIPVDVELSPRTPNNLEFKVGWATDTRERVGVAWNKPWLNSAGHSLTTDLEVSSVTQTLEAAYRIPGDDPLDDYYEIQVGAEQVNNRDTDSRSYSLQVGRHSTWGDWLRSYTLRWLHEDFTQGLDSGNVNLYLPGISLQRVRVAGNPSDPRRMDKWLASVEVTDQAIGSDLRVAEFKGRIAGMWRPFDNHRVVARVDGGVLLTDNFDDVPYSLRFFAGGDQSIRGYGYEAISPRDDDGNLIGARNLLTGSIGYQYRVLDKWWGATFFDAGSAFDKAEFSEIYRAVGVGVRWQSPISTIRIDLAFPLDDPGTTVRLHFALGPEF